MIFSEGFPKILCCEVNLTMTSLASVVFTLYSQTNFLNTSRIIINKGPAFTSTDFEKYYKEENTEHVPITKGGVRKRKWSNRENAPYPVFGKT